MSSVSLLQSSSILRARGWVNRDIVKGSGLDSLAPFFLVRRLFLEADQL